MADEPDILPLLARLAPLIVRIATATDTGRLPADVLNALLRGARWTSQERHLLARAGLDLAQNLRWYRHFSQDSELVPRWLVHAFELPPRPVIAAFGLPADWSLADPGRRLPADPVARLGVRGSLPDWLAARWIAAFGESEATELAEAMLHQAPVTLSPSTRVRPEALVASLAADGIQVMPGSGVTWQVPQRSNLTASKAWKSGWFEVQDGASRAVVDAVNARPGETIVDLCAGAGGKTWLLSEAVGEGGRVIAIEPDSARIHDLRTRLHRHFAVNVDVRVGSALDAELTSGLAGRVDAVLVDAPCSSLGVLRRSPGRKWLLEASIVTAQLPLQKALLEAGAALVKPGGRLVYATCSTEPEENEGIADAFTAASRGVWVEVGRFRTFPHRSGDDGFGCFSWIRGASAA